MLKHVLQLLVHLLSWFLVIEGLAKRDAPILREGNSIIGIGQILGREPEVNRMFAHQVECESWRKWARVSSKHWPL